MLRSSYLVSSPLSPGSTIAGVAHFVFYFYLLLEERPGHEVKFHSYSSCDLRDIVQRQIRVCAPCFNLSTLDGLSILMTQFQGDRDLRGPADFSAGTGGKYDEDGDDNDDDDDDESSRRPSKRKVSKLGMQSEMAGSDVVSIVLISLRYTI